MAFSKIIYNGTTLMDVTGTTAVPADVNLNKVFTKADGVQSTGTNTVSVTIIFEQDANGYIVLPDDSPIGSAVGVSF